MPESFICSTDSIDPNGGERLQFIVNMDFAAFLMFAGILLIAAEFCRPGWVWTGVMGGVAMIYGAYQMPIGVASALVVSAFMAITAGGLGWPKWTAAMAGATAIAACAQLDVHWLTAFSAMTPALVLYWLMTVAAKAAANKTIVG